MTHRCRPMLFVCSAPLLQTQIRRSINKGARRDANLVEGGLNRIIGKALVKDSYLTGAAAVADVTKWPGKKTEAGTHDTIHCAGFIGQVSRC